MERLVEAQRLLAAGRRPDLRALSPLAQDRDRNARLLTHRSLEDGGHLRSIDECLCEPVPRVGREGEGLPFDEQSQFFCEGAIDAEHAVRLLSREQLVLGRGSLGFVSGEPADFIDHIGDPADTVGHFTPGLGGEHVRQGPEPLEAQHGSAPLQEEDPWRLIDTNLRKRNPGAEHAEVARPVGDVGEPGEDLSGQESVTAVESERVDAAARQI